MKTDPPFQVNDSIICTDVFGEASSPNNGGEPLILNGIYTVAGMEWDQNCWWVSVKDDTGKLIFRRTPSATDSANWFASRFQPLKYLAPDFLPNDKQKVAVNNHTCPTCGNSRCSRAETNCWLCGGNL